MKLSPSEQESLVAILARIYSEIRDIEEEFQLLAGGHDFRPRIEHFHDAVRAFTSQDPKHRETGGRLSVELLAYDLSCLRYIHSMPLAPFKPHGQVMSPHTDAVAVKQGLTVKTARPDRATREHIAELYQRYAVLFAGLLKPFADADFHDRVDDLNQDIQNIHDLIHQLEAKAQGKGSEQALHTAIMHIEEEGLRHELMQLLQSKKINKKEAIKKLINFLTQHSTKKDKEIATIEAAHMNYALAQLGIFEGSKDLLKKMAAQGMNIVGRFVENAMAETRREMGR